MPTFCRISGIMAREAPLCVLFRRGPSKWVQQIKWNTEADTFEAGSWFNGHIYDRRSDLSPDGEFLIYLVKGGWHFSMVPKIGEANWTAISRPPSYKAIMLWPKENTWYGGGLFLTKYKVWLNHRPEDAVPHPDLISPLFEIIPNPDACGEDGPIWYHRLERDGWQLIQVGSGDYDSKRICWVMKEPEILEKEGAQGQKLRRKYHGSKKGGGEIVAWSLSDAKGRLFPISDTDWAEFDQQRRLVFARHGNIYRGEIVADRWRETMLIDLNDNKPGQDLCQPG